MYLSQKMFSIKQANGYFVLKLCSTRKHRDSTRCGKRIYPKPINHDHAIEFFFYNDTRIPCFSTDFPWSAGMYGFSVTTTVNATCVIGDYARDSQRDFDIITRPLTLYRDVNIVENAFMYNVSTCIGLDVSSR